MADLHCWEDRKSYVQETYGWGSPEHIETYSDDWRDGTCMLAAGHDGPHEFTPDDETTVEFGAANG